MAVQFGVHIGQQNASMADLRDLWRWLDRAGVDWISVWDHVYEAPFAGGTQPHFEAVATLATLAADTEHARLGCLVFCTPYRNIGILAKSIITIDHISGGRFEVGLGSGWYEQEAEAYGLPFPALATRSEVLEEQIAVFADWRRGERVTKQGAHVALKDASLLPGPLGRLPVWVGGVGRRRTLPLAARFADGWNASYVPATAFRELNHVLDDCCEQVGRQRGDIERSVNLSFNLNQDASTLERQWGQGADRLSGGSILGKPSDAMEQIAPYVTAGADLVNVVIRPPWDPETLASYCLEVIPAMKKEWS